MPTTMASRVPLSGRWTLTTSLGCMASRATPSWLPSGMRWLVARAWRPMRSLGQPMRIWAAVPRQDWTKIFQFESYCSFSIPLLNDIYTQAPMCEVDFNPKPCEVDADCNSLEDVICKPDHSNCFFCDAGTCTPGMYS